MTGTPTPAATPATPTAPAGAAASQLTGDLTIQTAAETRATLLAWLEGRDDLEVDLSEVLEMDTAGLQVLLLAKREATQRGMRLRLRAVPPAVLDVLHIVGLDADLEPSGVFAVVDAVSLDSGQPGWGEGVR